jgi:hypothetical protein
MELSPVEKALRDDKRKPAAERFQQRMRAARVEQGLPVPEELQEPASGVTYVAMTPALLAYVETLLGDKEDLEADALRIACGLPLLDEKLAREAAVPHAGPPVPARFEDTGSGISAGQVEDGALVSGSYSLCSPTILHTYHSGSGTYALLRWQNLGASRTSVALAA